MNRNTIERQKLIKIVSNLPDETLSELANFLDYLRYKTRKNRKSENNTDNLLSAVAGLGNSDQNDISERNKEIKQLRPFGLCAGEFRVPDDFDAPLPEEILSAFEGK